MYIPVTYEHNIILAYFFLTFTSSRININWVLTVVLCTQTNVICGVVIIVYKLPTKIVWFLIYTCL